jgi:ABC-type lipoprotein export system ATPase subunit
MILAACRDVTVSYAGHTVLDRVSCQVATGQHIAVVGRSGSGKTTLLHVLAGLEPATTGSAMWPELSGDPQSRVSVAFQSPSLIGALDVTENVALPLLLAGASPAAARARALDCLGSLSLAELAGSLPGELSGGQVQRVGLARALATRPALLLCDEPTGQLDRGTADELLSALLHLARGTQTAVVIATHDPLVAELMSTTWTIGDGHLQAGGLSW